MYEAMKDIQWAEIKASDYKAIQNLLKSARKRMSPNGRVETEKDWDVLRDLYTFWKIQKPQLHKAFQNSLKKYREAYKSNTTHSKDEEGGAQFQHTLEMPQSFYKIFSSFFPKQRLDRPFIRKLVQEIPEFRMSEKHHRI